MPTTYLLLRNNKQTGPHSLEQLLQQGLQPNDLIWEEGRSSGWSHPADVQSLKPYSSAQTIVQQSYASDTTTLPPIIKREPQPLPNGYAHIYVAFPAGRQPLHESETPAAPSLEAKAEALYERVQAFASGRLVEDKDQQYARSLQDMKQEYSAWRVQQQKKKKQSSTRKKILIAASVFVVTTTSLGITKWMRTETAVVQEPVAGYTSETIHLAAGRESETVSLLETADTSTIQNELPVVQNKTQDEVAPPKNRARPVSAKTKNAAAKSLSMDSSATDTGSAVAPPEPENKTVLKKEERKLVPLSRLVLVDGALQYDKKGTTITATDITLRNNSTETLKSVSIFVTYFKKENRPLNKETIIFYNVQPLSAPVINSVPNRRSTSARFKIGTITRADGSLYLIN